MELRRKPPTWRYLLAMNRRIFGVGALLAMAAVALGAFGAHALKERISDAMLEVFRTGVNYHLAHSFAILICAFAFPVLGSRVRICAWLFGLGILLFAGSLYALAVTGNRKLGIITPFGGAAFLFGWLLLALAAFKPPSEVTH